MSISRSIFPAILYFTLAGSFFGGAIGFIIISGGTGHVPWQAVMAVPLAIGTLLGALLGSIYLSTRKE